MAWRLAKSLDKLRTQVNKEWPNRNKASDGTIGDTAHSSRVSQHNPNSAGVVTAMDITHDPKNGADMNKLKTKLIKDNRTWYIIFNRKIWQKNTGWQTYSGTNPHDKHLHISVKQTALQYDNPKDWTISGTIEDMITSSQLNILSRFYRGASPTEDQKKWIGKKTFEEVQKSFIEGTAYKSEIAQAKEGKLTNQELLSHLPAKIRKVYKEPS